MKRILIIIPVLILSALTGCLKDKPNVDFSNLSYVAEISTASTSPTFNAPASGLEFFASANLSFPTGDSIPDTVSFTVNIASPTAPTKDIPITLAIDQTALASYNNTPGNLPFQQFPDSTFSFPATSGTVKAGNNNRLDTFYVIFYPQMISIAESYMLPISITAAPGTTISGNLGTIYFHIVGNPIAGAYTWNWTRWNNTDSSGPTSGGGTNLPGTFTPTSPTSIETHSGYYIQPRYEVSFTNTGGVLSNFTVTLNAADVATMAGGGVTVTTNPVVILADPINGNYEFFYQVVNSSGPRTVIDRFTR